MAKYNWRKYIVVAYSLEGNIVGIFLNAKEAADKNGLSKRHVEKCLRGEYNTAKNMQWRRYPHNVDIPQRISPFVKEDISRDSFPILKVDKEGNVVKEYSSIRSAAKENKTTPKSIRQVLKGIQHTAGGYIWKKKEK